MHYEYERVDMKNNVVYQARVMDEIHRKLIDERARQGHRFVGYVPTVSGANGKILSFDLVFEVKDESK